MMAETRNGSQVKDKQNNINSSVRRFRRGRIGRRTKDMVAIAKERIQILLSRAEDECIKNKNQTRANRYVLLARKIAMRYNIRINNYFRHKICRSCNSFLGSTSSSQVRCQGGKMIIHCKNCGRITRVPINSRK